VTQHIKLPTFYLPPVHFLFLLALQQDVSQISNNENFKLPYVLQPIVSLIQNANAILSNLIFKSDENKFYLTFQNVEKEIQNFATFNERITLSSLYYYAKSFIQLFGKKLFDKYFSSAYTMNLFPLFENKKVKLYTISGGNGDNNKNAPLAAVPGAVPSDIIPSESEIESDFEPTTTTAATQNVDNESSKVSTNNTNNTNITNITNEPPVVRRVYREGETVEFKLKNNEWKEGRVLRRRPDNTYDISYDKTKRELGVKPQNMQPFQKDINANNLAYTVTVKLSVYKGKLGSAKDKFNASCDNKFNYLKNSMFDFLGLPYEDSYTNTSYNQNKTKRRYSSYSTNRTRRRS
jgi:hypothetical protein